MRCAPSIGFILSVVLVGSGCGRTHPLPVPPVPGVEPRDGSVAGPDARTPLDAGASGVSDAAGTLDAKDGPEVLVPLDAGARDGDSDGGRVPYRALAVVTGEAHTCALLDDHHVKCWGDNSFGQLGYGDLQRRGNSPSEMGDALPIVDLGTGRSAVAIAAGRYASCAILDDGSLRCWGWAGLGGHEQANSPGNNIGDEPGEMGDHLQAVDFGGRKAVHLAMGEIAACASMEDDTIWCWDEATPWLQFSLPVKRVAALAPSENGIVARYEDGSLSPQLPNGTVPLLVSGRKALAVAGSNGSDTCALLDDGTTTCVQGASQSSGPAGAIAIGVERVGGLCSVLSNGSVKCRVQQCTQPTYFPCASDGSFSLGVPAVAVTSNGTEFACALLADGDVKCWGANLTMPPAAWLGAAIDFTKTSDGVTYGAWHSVDLGTRP